MLAILMPGAPRAAGDSAAFVSDIGARAIKVLSSPAPESERETQFRALFEAGFDVPAIARFALGRYWQAASERQHTEFTELFTAFMVHVYTVRFNDLPGQQFKVTGSRPEGDSGSLVSSEMGGSGEDQSVKIDWRVAAASGGFKITDLLVDGTSMAVTQRQEFAAVIQHGGGDVEALLKLLRAKVPAN
jgi:phospholipid transport system substrate-binding protein